MIEMSDPSIYSMAAEGNLQAQSELYKKHKEKIFSVAYFYTRNRQDAEEILQKTFIQAFKWVKKRNFESDSHFSSWLQRVSINTSINHLKQNRKKRAISMEDLSLETTRFSNPESFPEETMIRRQIIKKITLFLEKCSYRQRMIFVLKYYQHYTTFEIASLLDCSEGNVKSQLFHLMAKLRKSLGPLWRNHEL